MTTNTYKNRANFEAVIATLVKNSDKVTLVSNGESITIEFERPSNNLLAFES